MKRFLISGMVFASMVAGVFAFGQLVRAVDTTAPMTEAHIERIRTNCSKAQLSLRQLHASDALLRVNRGQLYESISVKLMAPFNSRVALNRLDGASLIATASDYTRELEGFRKKYKEYEESMSKILRINCTNEPVAFYDTVANTREKRQEVHESTQKLHETINKYEDEFETFTKSFKEKQK